MGVKRFITSDIASDEVIAAIAEEDTEAALAWPWFLLAFDDWGRAIASSTSIRLRMFPAFSIDTGRVERIRDTYHEAGLIHCYEVDGKYYMSVKPTKWMENQTYLVGKKRHSARSKFPVSECSPWGILADARLIYWLTIKGERQKLIPETLFEPQEITFPSNFVEFCRTLSKDDTPSPSPSLSLQSTPIKTKTKATKNKTSYPYGEILDAYHETLTSLPNVRAYGDSLKRLVKARCDEDSDRLNPDWWKKYFCSVKTMPHLMGDNDRGWRASFEWLVRPTNMSKVLNGSYKTGACGSHEPTDKATYAKEKEELEMFGGDVSLYGKWKSEGRPPVEEFLQQEQEVF